MVSRRWWSRLQGPTKGILGYTENQVVSWNFNSDSLSSTFDAEVGISLNGNFIKFTFWYDTEYGYRNSMVELMTYMASKE